MGRESTRFKPRIIDEEMPPIFPYQAWIKNCQIINCETGILAENFDGLIIENLTTRQTYKPIVARRGRRLFLRGLDFQP
jgi:hypothetical protein